MQAAPELDASRDHWGNVKPRWRGRLHQIAFIVSIPAGLALVAVGSGVEARIVAAVFAASLSAVYGTSAAYHRGRWNERAHDLMRRLDHSMIFVLIAGTYTPILLIVMHPAWGVTLLAIVWTGAIVGIVLSLALSRSRVARRVAEVLYLALGWCCVIAIPQMLGGLSPLELGLVVVGGVLYTVGFVVLTSHRPNPSPLVFGYHEVWHVLVVAAGLCHYGAILLIVS